MSTAKVFRVRRFFRLTFFLFAIALAGCAPETQTVPQTPDTVAGPAMETTTLVSIRELQSYPGITGSDTFNAEGDPDPARYDVFQVISPDPEDWEQNVIAATYELALPE